MKPLISMSENEEVIESLSAIEREVLPSISEKETDAEIIVKKTGRDKTAVLRALEFLKNKNLVSVDVKEKKIVDLDVNGIHYVKKHLPERRLLNCLEEKKSIPLNEISKTCGLNENEGKVALGVLKRKAMVDILNGRALLNAKKEEITKKMFEEVFLEKLPMNFDELQPEDKFALKNLESRKNIIKIEKEKKFFAELTSLGREVLKSELNLNLVEQVTPKIIQTDSWKGKKFRKYDIRARVPRISGGKRHFVNQATEYSKSIWLEMGFKEMTGNLAVTSFWNFDALFTAQDHPVREMQDTFFIKGVKGKLPDKKLIESVKKSHEGGENGSRGWQYEWNEDAAKRVLLRTHTTCLSAQTLKKIAENKEFPAKYFALGKCFRNETVDWSHGFEFNQTEGIVVDENANFRQLLGYLIEFYKKMGFEKLRIRPSYFPYTEPSLEIDYWHPGKNKWFEIGGAGMFRPEVTIPMFGRHIPVLAWGPGFDRIIMEFFDIKDLREMYKNDISKLREMKFWSRE
jgi:phenylalanyl-tRNA synthetase alpha chain